MTQRLDYPKAVLDAMKAFGGVRHCVAASGLFLEFIDLGYLRASQVNGCSYCMDLHTRGLLKSGMKIDKIALVSVYCEEAPYCTGMMTLANAAQFME